MGSGGSLGFALLCWALAGALSSSPWDSSWRSLGFLRGRGDSSWRQPQAPAFPQASPWAWVDVSQLQAASPLHPVAVHCQEAQMVVTVHRDLFGTGRLVRAADLMLGPAACRATGATESTVTFAAGLHECGSLLQMTPDSLIYKTSLSYKPTPTGNLVIIRTSPAVVPIECHYPRRNNVSSNAIRPTWAPFRSTLSSEEKLAFSLRLMNGECNARNPYFPLMISPAKSWLQMLVAQAESSFWAEKGYCGDDWSAERLSNGFQLGESLHFQADVNAENHVPLRLFVDECVATLTPDKNSSPRYALIDLSGCLVDGRSDETTSVFLSPRPRQETLQFVVDVFKFARDDRNLIYITCHLKVSPVEQPPNSLNKACFFNKASSLWVPVEGTGDICSCCETGHCHLQGGHSRRANPLARWPGRRLRRDAPSGRDGSLKGLEADISVGPLIILDPARGLWSSSEGLLPAGKTAQGAAEGLSTLVQVVMLIAATVLSLTALAIFLVCKKMQPPSCGSVTVTPLE